MTAEAQVSWEMRSRVPVGQTPAFVVRGEGAGQVDGDVTCGGRAPIHFSVALSAGSRDEVAVPGLAEGRHACVATLHLRTPDGAVAHQTVPFQVEVRSPLAFRVDPTDWDRATRSLVVHPSRPLRVADAKVIGLGGREIDGGPGQLVDPSNPSWTFATTDEVLQIVVTAEDDVGIRAQLTLSPWFYAIPHEDVVFATGSSAIDAAEVPKLTAVWTQVRDVLDRYGSVVAIRLYVAGYTDTVGSPASNRTLSQARARSIAQWFAAKGFPGEVFCQGFGEQALAVPTPDETDQLANRRAVYLLASEPPPPSADLPAVDWARVK